LLRDGGEAEDRSAGEVKALLGTSWTVVGTLCFAMWQWALMVLAAHSAGGAEAVGALSVALAISTPAFLLFGMSLRQVAATDVQLKFADPEYLQIRALAVLAALAVNAMLGLAFSTPELFWLVIACSLLKATESIADIAYGLKQRAGRDSDVGMSQAGKAILQSLIFGILIHFGLSLTTAIVAIAALSLVLTLGFDGLTPARIVNALSGRARNHDLPSSASRLVRSAAQSGIAACLVAVAAGLPRVLLEHESGTAVVGAFTATMWMFMPGHVVANAVCQSLLSRAALAQFNTGGISLTGYAAIFCGVSSMPALLPGAFYLVTGIEPALLVFGSGFEVGGWLLLLATGANLAVAFASGCNYAAAAVHAHDAQLKAALCSSAVCLMTCLATIDAWGAAGAFGAVGAAALAQAAVSAAFLRRRLSSQEVRAT
jgi:O-antigen/teichoic acid export membrane protein